jgi:hypothetical protein
MHHDVDTDRPLAELRRNFVAALLALVVIGCGALLFVSLMDLL